MPTLLYIAVQNEDGTGSKTTLVAEDFDTVIEKLFPVQQPSSSLEARTAHLYHAYPNGYRLMIQPANVFLVEEVDPAAAE